MIYRNTADRFGHMPTTKVAVTIDESTLAELDRLVRDGTFANRSRAVETAVREKLDRLTQNRLARECAKLDPAAEAVHADEGLAADHTSWPEY